MVDDNIVGWNVPHLNDLEGFSYIHVLVIVTVQQHQTDSLVLF